MEMTAAWCQTMARYNHWQNQSLLAAAEALDEAAWEQERGAFFGSIRATFSHLLWADHMWMSRFDGWDRPEGGMAGSVVFAPDRAAVIAMREATDARISDWAGRLEDADILEDLRFHSAALGAEAVRSMALCVTHFFNHQTHHRGQIHSMLTQAGCRPGPTDLFFMPDVA